MAIDLGRIEAAVTELLTAIGDDPTRPGVAETPRRVAESYAEFFAGMDRDPTEPLREAMAPDDVSHGLVMLRDIPFRSICEHHLLPFEGVAQLGYLPGDRVVGLGRLAEVVEILSARPQVQERLTEQIADALERGLDPRGVIVVLEARHQCVTARGPRIAQSSMVTTATRGELSDAAVRAEALALATGSPATSHRPGKVVS